MLALYEWNADLTGVEFWPNRSGMLAQQEWNAGPKRGECWPNKWNAGLIGIKCWPNRSGMLAQKELNTVLAKMELFLKFIPDDLGQNIYSLFLFFF